MSSRSLLFVCSKLRMKLVKPSKPTTYDVAKRANVSQMTVSRVLRGKGYASGEVIEKVLKAADEIGYVRNNLAGSFAGQSSNLVGVIIPSLSNSVFTEVLSGFDEAIRDAGLQPAIGVSNYDQTREHKLVRDMLAWRPAGIVLTGMEHEERTRKLLRQNKVETIEIIDVDGEPISRCVGLSHRLAAEAMAAHLIERGHKRFGYIGSALQSDSRALKRKNAFETVLRTYGFEFSCVVTSPEPSSMLLGRQLTADLLKETHAPLAVYYSNDDLASGGLLQCLAQGLSLPRDIAIASFNGLEFLDAMPMQITTFKSPRYEIGQIAGRIMLGSISDNTTRLEGALIVGDTT